MIIDIIAGARPNFMKIAPIIEAIEIEKNRGTKFVYRLIHTGQHYDKNMSETFFEELGIPKPDINLECGGGTQAEQTAQIMVKFEKDLLQYPADLVLVVGDVTSTMACSIVAKKLLVKVAHVEAGIRSFDLAMPEEINRIVTDSITDYFFTTSENANCHLRKAGIPDARIFFVGNTMIDTLLKQMPRFQRPTICEQYQLKEHAYIVMTLHRPGNVDEGKQLKALIEAIIAASNGMPLVFPVHPRTAGMLETLGLDAPNLYLTEPLGYLEFNYLVQHSKAVITDSGGITEETTVMNIPCMTLRNTTERPETCSMGTNELLGTNCEAIAPAFKKLFAGKWKKSSIPDLWDGNTGHRIVNHLKAIYSV
jgi:UDP-N-acetylglucosamine 2-epimerase (non-hydrolysing)